MYLLRINLICLFVIGLMVGCTSQKTEVAEDSAAPAAKEVSLAVTGMT
jgi:hypothetical protein